MSENDAVAAFERAELMAYAALGSAAAAEKLAVYYATCTCGHHRDYHGNADGQTGWQARCGHPDCECDNFQRAIS